MPELLTLLKPTADRILCWSAETILVGSALAAVAALACRPGRRGLALGPAARHALWLVVLIKLMAPPIVHWPWSVRVATAPAPADDRRDGLAEPLDFDLVSEVEAIPAPRDEPRDPAPVAWPALSTVARGLGPWVVSAWLAGSVALGAVQARRILRFRRRLRDAEQAPAWLVDEAARVGRRLGVRVPEVRIIPGLGTPLLWCLGRPVLLVPDDLLATLDRGRWPAILAHELAHLRRLDPWVRRLELVAGLVWWWNPLYRLTRSRLDFEAELACDAWVLWALPDDRLAYAESLLQIGSIPSPAAIPMPALGVAGAARSFERRLTMILSDRVACRVPASGFLGAAILALLALPSWTLADPILPAPEPAPASGPILDEPAGPAEIADRDDDDDDDKDKDKDDDAQRARKKAAEDRAKAAADRAKAAADRAMERTKERAKAAADRAKEKAENAAKSRRNKGENAKEIEIEMRVEKSLGPDFEKKMEALGKEMEAKFGPGSDFEKKMKAMGKEMEAKYGPGSEFEKEMKAMAEKMAKEFGPGSKFAEDMKAAQEKKGAKARALIIEDRAPVAEKAKEVNRDRVDRAARARTEATTTRKARRIEALEAQIKKLAEELKRLKAEGDEDEEG